MAKVLTLNYQGKDYTLEYTRKTVTEMERSGFVASDIEKKPMTILPELFRGAFLAHHRFVKKEIIDEILGKITNKDEFIGKLAEMYNEPLLALVEEPEESEGNATWTANW